jgi:hypothetical protein
VQLFSDDWEEYVSECELFTWQDPATVAASAAEGEAGRRLLGGKGVQRMAG